MISKFFKLSSSSSSLAGIVSIQKLIDYDLKIIAVKNILIFDIDFFIDTDSILMLYVMKKLLFIVSWQLFNELLRYVKKFYSPIVFHHIQQEPFHFDWYHQINTKNHVHYNCVHKRSSIITYKYTINMFPTCYLENKANIIIQ